MFAPEESPETPEPILPENIFVSPITWSEETLPLASTSTYTPPGCPPESQYIPRARRTALIHSAHTSLGTGHPGIHETLSLLKERFWWPNMTVDVTRYVQGCEGCVMSKDPRHLPAGKLLPLPVPSCPWSHLGVNFVTDLPTSREHTCIFIVVDRFSKSCHLLPLKGPPTALETAELIFNHVFRYFGIPEDIVSDRGPQFVSRVWRVFLTRLGVAVRLSSRYHPQTGRQKERSRRSAATSIPSAIATRTRGASTWVRPAEPSDVPAVDHWFHESERVWDSAHHQLQWALHRRRRTADLWRSDPPAIQPGQKVWLSTRDIRLRLPCRKLSPRFIGPFTILKQINPVTYKLQLPPGYRIHPTFHVSLLKPHYPSVFPSTEPGVGAAEPPLPLLLDNGTAYKVKEILDYRRRGGRLEYLVDWEGYGPEERSWVARDDILDPNLLEAFHTAHPHRPAPRGRGRPPRRRGSAALRSGPWGGGHKGSVQCVLGSSHGRGPRRPKPWTKNLAFGTWNITSLGGKEPELVREVERYRLKIVRLASMHSLGSGTQLLERGWTLFFSGVPHAWTYSMHWGVLQLSLNAGTRVSTSKLEAMVLNWKKVACTLQVGREVLPQVEEFNISGFCLQVREGWIVRFTDGSVQRQQ
ncbi:hypothetical protein QTP70_032207 [Hemibagrus guttatus]|uniref:Gypsy retrotransposon integrase-like protein 1 n=1 Tax=Hemibagrus guttatus TaxID=175788 RepID=A0AAE0PWI6_9TELE|nr:hypothetical protein QTP70_032207 [Hemibagrus guttatus]